MSQLKSLAVALAAAGAFALPFIHVHWLALPVIDDAAISIAYGLSFWEGFGFRLTHQSEIVEGFSSPVWALWTGLGARTGLDPLLFARWTGVLLGALGIMVLAASDSILSRSRLRTSQVAPLLLCVGFPSLSFWLGSGMEIGPQILAMALAYVASQASPARAPAVGATMGALVLVRPEFVVVGFALLAVWAAHAFASDRRAVVMACGSWTLIVLAFFAVRLWYFADLLPNTYYVKRHWDFGAANYVGSYLLAHIWLVVSALTGGVAAVVAGKRRSVFSLLIVVLAALHFGWMAKGDWMREWRFLVFTVPFLLLPASLALSGIPASGESTTRRRRLTVSALAGLSVCCALLGVALQRNRHRELKAAPEFPARFVMDESRRLEQSLETKLVKRAHLGMPDVGGLALVFRNATITDVAGLADYALAHADGTNAMEDYLLNEGPPLVMDAHGPSGHVALPRLREFFPGWTRGVAVMNLTSTEDPRCPGMKEPLLDGSVDQAAVIADLLGRDEPIRALRFWRCVISYSETDRLLNAEARLRLAQNAQARADTLIEGQPERALRFMSLATVLTEDPWMRRRTEQLRRTLFPGAARP